MIQGMSRALTEEVQFRNRDGAGGFVSSSDWYSYPVLRFGDALPEIDTVLINNHKVPPTGAGETIITLVASAIGNAVYDATGVRMRQIPMTPFNFFAARGTQKV